MGEVYTDIMLKNSGDIELAHRGYIKTEDVREVSVNAVVDTGAYDLCLTEEVFKTLGLRVIGHLTANVADGRSVTCSITAPVDVHWKDRSTTVRATVVPGSKEVLLGAIPLEGMDLMVHPKKGEVVGVHGDQALYRI